MIQDYRKVADFLFVKMLHKLLSLYLWPEVVRQHLTWEKVPENKEDLSPFKMFLFFFFV